MSTTLRHGPETVAVPDSRPGRHARPYRETSEWFAGWRSRGPFVDDKPGRHRADTETEQVAS